MATLEAALSLTACHSLWLSLTVCDRVVSLLSVGTLNALLRQKGQAATEGPTWSLSGNQGDHWKQAKVSIHPTASFQVSKTLCDWMILESARGRIPT